MKLSKWLYWPPEECDLKPLSEQWRPPGHLFLSEAVDIVGRATFGEEWSGQELKARAIGGTLPKLPSELEDTLWIDGEPSVRRLPTGRLGGGGWRVITTRGGRVVESEEAASALWKEERPKLLEMWKAEHSARTRFGYIVRSLRTDLYSGALRAWAHQTNVGDLIEIPAHVWGRDGIEGVFEFASDPVSWRGPISIQFKTTRRFRTNLEAYRSSVPVEGRVLLSESDVQTYVKQQHINSDALGPGTIVAERKCGQWIKELASQGFRPETKEALWRDAAQRWGVRLSRRGFERAWANASPDDWKRSGRKSKR